MGKSLQVKVKTTTLITSLEKALTEREKRWAESEKSIAQYAKDKKAYEEAIVKLVKTGKVKITDANLWRNRYSDDKMAQVNITGEIAKTALPKEPESPNSYTEYEYKNDKEAIENAVRVLKMTEQEYVNASTIASVSKFL
jgi:hypothetical protein